MSFSYFLLVGPVIIPLANRCTFVVMATKACIKYCIYRILVMLIATLPIAFIMTSASNIWEVRPKYSVKSTWK